MCYVCLLACKKKGVACDAGIVPIYHNKTLRCELEPKKEPREREAWYRAFERDVQFVLPQWIPLFRTRCANRW